MSYNFEVEAMKPQRLA